MPCEPRNHEVFLMKNPELRQTIIEDGTLTNYIRKRNELISEGHLELIRTVNPELYELDQETAQECENARRSKKQQREKIENHIKWHKLPNALNYL